LRTAIQPIEDAMQDAAVRNVLSRGRFGFVIFGAAHDLTESIKRLAPGCEYIRVVPKGVKDDNVDWEEMEKFRSRSGPLRDSLWP
jgi:hypothetical protein